MPLDWSPWIAFVQRHRRFLLTTHVRPDGDGLGSMLALTDALQEQGKEVQMVIASVMPARYQFLDAEGRIKRFPPPGEAWRKTEAVVVLDTGTWNQLGDVGAFLHAFPGEKVVIDHHQTQDDLGAIRLVDVMAEATGRLVFQAIRALGLSVGPSAAQQLFVAIAMDTGWFRHSNTTAATFALMAELVSAGAHPEVLYEQLFEQNTLQRLKLMGRALDRLKTIAAGRISYTEIHRNDYEETGASPSDSEDLVNFPRSVAGTEVGLLFMEQPRGGVKVSFRSRARVDVARLAERFGGGGHRLASGAVVELPLDQARALVLEAVVAQLDSAS